MGFPLTRAKNFSLKFIRCRDEPIKSTETRQGWKQKTTLIGKNGGKERQEHYPTSVAYMISTIGTCYAHTISTLKYVIHWNVLCICMMCHATDVG